MEPGGAIISITRLRVRSWRFLPGFLVKAMRSGIQARRHPGSLRVALLREAHRTFWTATAWRDEEAMRAFMLAGAHRGAMKRLLDWCDEASVVHWVQDSPELPAWDEAHRRMQEEGRPSKVRFPTDAHRQHRIAPPVLRHTTPVRLK